MAKLFGIFESKIPNKDLTKEDAEYKGFKGFFTILKTKLWKMVQLNFIYVMLCIPLFILFYLGSQVIVPGGTVPMAETPADYPFIASWNGINVSSAMMLGYNQFWTDLINRIAFFILLISVPVLAIGPLKAGFSHNIMSFIRGNPVFLMTDFIDKARSNFKQSLLVSFMDLILAAIIAVDFRMYLENFGRGDGGFLAGLALVILLVATVVYLVMHMYVYPLMVTFRMNLRQLFKNSFYLAMISFIPALGILLIDLLVVFIPFFLFRNPLLHILVSLLILPSLLSLINTYCIYPYIKKYLLDPALKELEDNSETEDEAADY